MNTKLQFKKYKEFLKDNVYDLSEKGLSVLTFVVYTYNLRDEGIQETHDDFSWEEWA